MVLLFNLIKSHQFERIALDFSFNQLGYLNMIWQQIMTSATHQCRQNIQTDNSLFNSIYLRLMLYSVSFTVIFGIMIYRKDQYRVQNILFNHMKKIIKKCILFDEVLERFEKLQKAILIAQHAQLFNQLAKQIDFHREIVGREQMYQERNQFYLVHENAMMRDLQVVRNVKQLNERTAFIQDEIIEVLEGQHVEYKYFNNDFDNQRKFVLKKMVTAFLNGNGGVLYIGVDDSRKVIGFYSKQVNDVTAHITSAIDTIHPRPIYGTNYTLQFVNLFDLQGNQVPNRMQFYQQLLIFFQNRVIRIIISEYNKNSNQIYTFSEFIKDFNSEATFCFERKNDSSKVIRHTRLKKRISEQALEDYGHSHRYRQQSEMLVQKEQKYQQEEIGAKYKRKENANNDLEQPNKNSVNQEFNQIPNEELQAKERDEWKSCLIFRKILPASFDQLIMLIEDIKETSSWIQQIEIVSGKTRNIVILFNDSSQIQDFLQLLEIKLITEFELTKFQFTYGYPTKELQIQFWLEDLTQEDIVDFSQEIKENIKLFNFKLSRRESFLLLNADSVLDLLTIYKGLKIQYNVTWKLQNSQDYIS